MGSTRPVHIYVDGSCGENRNVTSDTKAGWGFCVISEDTGSGNGKGSLLMESFGHVVTNPEDDGFWVPKWVLTTPPSYRPSPML